VVALALIGGVVAVLMLRRVEVEVDGIAEGQVVMRRDLADLTVRIDASGLTAGDVSVQLNGDELATSTEGGVVVARPERLVQGPNTLVVSVDSRIGIGGATVERRFLYDPSGPSLQVPRQFVPPPPGEVATMRGLVSGARSLTANGQPVPIEPGGAFTINVLPGTTEIAFEAHDGDGNPVSATVEVTSSPDAVDHPDTRAVHVTAAGWADPAIREQVIDLARTGRINAVQLDIKDEGGEVGYTSAVPLAKRVGAIGGYYDAKTALDELHGLGVRVIGRIVCFLDPTLAEWAWSNDRPEMVVLDGVGSAPLANNYGTAAFTNLADDAVRKYQIDLAVEATGLGFDEILYDYVRRPEGDMSEMQFAGLEGGPDVAIARFVSRTATRMAEVDEDAKLGVSVFGIASTRPEQMAQDISLLAPLVDYVSPMVYPSHWGDGEFGVADPNRQPGDIVKASVEDFHRVAAGSGAAIVPWLQDFDSGDVIYGPAEVRAQIDAVYATGSQGFLLWNSGSLYTAAGLPARGD